LNHRGKPSNGKATSGLSKYHELFKNIYSPFLIERHGCFQPHP
jgi:hypothetical protein